MASKPGSKRGKLVEAESSPSQAPPSDTTSSGVVGRYPQPVVNERAVAEQQKYATMPALADEGPAAVLQTETKRDVPINNTPIGANTSMSILEFSSSIADAELPEPIPAGEYPAEIRSAEIAISEKGNRYAKIALYISPDSYPADFTEGDPDGTQLTYNRLSLNDDARSRYRLRKFLETVGLTPGQSVDLNDWMGLAVTVRIKHGEWEGEKRAEVERIVSGA